MVSSVARPLNVEFDELDRYAVRIPLPVLEQWLTRTAISLEQVRPFLRFGVEYYVRNLMHAGPVSGPRPLLARRPAKPDSRSCRFACEVRVIQGIATETTFACSETGLLHATGSCHLATGEICARQDDDVHQISNLQAGDLVTLHIYSPPLWSMNMYSISHTQVCRFVDPINDEFVSGAGI